MFRSLLDEILIRHTLWRRRLVLNWQIGERDGLIFVAILSVPIAIFGLIVYFAFAARATIDGSRIDAARRRALDLRCLAENIYFEARGEPLRGQQAIAEVTMNRLASPHFPDTICDVVHDRRWDPLRRRIVAHFSWTVFDLKQPKGPAWEQSMKIATAVYDDLYMPVVPGALFYHATSVQPYWARSKREVARIGNHIFYR